MELITSTQRLNCSLGVFFLLEILNLFYMENSELFVTPHFKRSEFACKDHTPVPAHLFYNMRMLAGALEYIRGVFRLPIVIHSAYRTPNYNKRVGGAVASYHLSCMAADISIKGVTPRHVYNTIKQLILSKQLPTGGVILYPTFVHYDMRNSNYFEERL